MSGAGDPERDQALDDYKRSLLELREWEAKLKSLRMGIKDLQREFDVSEENIKALQSVGQIIGEVLKQLDEERCTYPTVSSVLADITDKILKRGDEVSNFPYSYCQGIIGSSVCRWLPFKGRQGQDEAGYSCSPGYDDAYHYANASTRGRSSGLQHVFGGSWVNQLCWYWWFE